MATPFRLKRSAIEGKRPAQSDLQLGELALNTYDGYLYTEREGVGIATVTNLTPWYENYGGGSIYYSNSVGIGTTVPQYKLDVRKGSIGGYDALRAPHSDVIVEIEVKVISKTEDHRYKGTGSGLGYTLDGVESPFLTLVPGRTYRFKQDDNTNSTHPIAFYLTADKATQYTGGVTTNGSAGSSGAYVDVAFDQEAPTTMYFKCANHSGMGNTVHLGDEAGDIAGVTAGDGLSGGGTSGTVTVSLASSVAGDGLAHSSGVLSLDLNELTAATVDPSADSIAIIDGGSSNVSRKESIADLATMMAGDGLSASSGAFAVDSTVVVTSGTQTVGGNKTFSNDIVVSGNLTVSGTTTTINTETLLLEDNIITLNSGTSGAPSQNSGITVDRGSSADVFLQFNETSDTWQFTNDGTTYTDIGAGGDVVDDTTPQLGGDLDVNGNKIDMDGNELILDADADTSITADTDDTIDFKIGGIDAVKMSHGNAYTTQSIISTLDNSYASPALRLYKNSSSPANWDYGGALQFRMNDSGLNETTYAQLLGRAVNVSNGFEEGSLLLYVAAGGNNNVNTVFYDTKIQLFREQTLEWYQHKGTTYTNVLDWATPTADRTVTLPNATGTVALTSDFTGSANHAFRQISDGSNQAVADSNIDTFTVTAGTDISAVVTPVSDTLTITNTSTLDSVTTRGATTNTSITFPDNVKARFGDTSSPDMEIYHDGNNSYIDDTGTGSIFIRSGTTYIPVSYTHLTLPTKRIV